MRHDIHLDGPAFRLRPVGTGDAGDIVRLRSDPELGRFIHAGATSVEAQVQWLDTYFDRDGDYYWAVERSSDGTIEGFVSIYDVEGQHGEWGRWVLRRGSLAAPESVWLMYRAAFDLLGLEFVVLRVLTGNRPVIAFHERYGVAMDRLLPRYAHVRGTDHDAVEGRMTRELWAVAGPQLLGMAERAATLLNRAAARA